MKKRMLKQRPTHTKPPKTRKAPKPVIDTTWHRDLRPEVGRRVETRNRGGRNKPGVITKLPGNEDLIFRADDRTLTTSWPHGSWLLGLDWRYLPDDNLYLDQASFEKGLKERPSPVLQARLIEAERVIA